MPSLWSWELDTTDPVDRQATHRLLTRWLGHEPTRKGWSWTPFVSGDRPTIIEIGLVDDDLAGPLITAADRYRRNGRFEHHLAMTRDPQQCLALSWHELRSSGGGRHHTLEFTSPVTFRRGNQFLPWPTPSAVFGSLRAVWRTYGAPHIGDLTLDLKLDPLNVTWLSGTTQIERLPLGPRHQHPDRKPNDITVGGFLGRIRYTWTAPTEDQLPAVHALTRLAAFSGVGAWTTHGFGGTRPHRD